MSNRSLLTIFATLSVIFISFVPASAFIRPTIYDYDAGQKLQTIQHDGVQETYNSHALRGAISRCGHAVQLRPDAIALAARGTQKLLPAARRVPNAGGAIRSFVTQQDEVFFRVFSGNRTGGFLTRVRPSSRGRAIEGLALPPGNTAEFIQEVLVPAGTRLQRSRALPAFGRRGGLEQFELLERIPGVNFGPGVPLR